MAKTKKNVKSKKCVGHKHLGKTCVHKDGTSHKVHQK